ncbi:uncharacterized protein LOC124349586 [Daphnia pulicaria]|uniref:uncharacterized protein LOC124349586 n=1 Tax=Daphnia pulicaria TaxID=35523 RepID=UPI001EEBA61E|nr:uncharacterized protein LOC124349586 [Daphnia pulicaria]
MINYGVVLLLDVVSACDVPGFSRWSSDDRVFELSLYQPQRYDHLLNRSPQVLHRKTEYYTFTFAAPVFYTEEPKYYSASCYYSTEAPVHFTTSNAPDYYTTTKAAPHYYTEAPKSYIIKSLFPSRPDCNHGWLWCRAAVECCIVDD